jgi:hypothetical protein
MDQKQRAFFESYCLDCHNAEKQKGDVRLDDLAFSIRDIPTAERWQKVLNVLNSGEMPPEDKKQPKSAEKAAFLEHLSETMVTARRVLNDAGGVITMRRLNKREYQNTLFDLLGIRINVRDLPNDGGGNFDTIGKSLFFSSDQFQQYLTLGRKALDAVFAAGPHPAPKKVRIEAETEANERVQLILRGYQIAGFRAYKQWKASNGRPPTDFGIIDASEMDFRKHVWERNSPAYIDYVTRPENAKGAFLTIGEPNQQVGLVIPDDMPPGTYKIRACIGAAPDAPAERTFVELGVRGNALNSPMTVQACRKVAGTIHAPEVHEFEVSVQPVTVPMKVDIGTQTKKRVPLGDRVYAFRERQHNSGYTVTQMVNKAVAENGFAVEPTLWMDWVEWEGPLPHPARFDAYSQIFFKGPNASKDDDYVREILTRFAKRAFRGAEIKSSYLDKLVGHFREKRESGEDFEEAIKTPLSVILASPSFLYMSEPSGKTAGEKTLSGRELATRLAYFLWSSPPDAELLRLGESGALLQPPVLAAQADRLMASPKVREFLSGFLHQWLHMDRLDFFQFNPRLYPTFDDSVKHAAREEIFETVGLALREDLPVGVLLKSDFVVVNDLLAGFYGIPGVEGAHFRRVPVPEGLPRGGFLGMAAVLAMGSDGERSSPVERGAWVLRKLLHKPPPPAPANVPQLSRLAGKLLPARELLAAHMEEPQCYQCHHRIDPIGFGLEHFNAVGLWREKETTEIANNNQVKKSQDHPIDATGSLPDGTAFDGFFELRDGIAKQQEAFTRCLTEQLIAYGLGRSFGFTDEPLATSLIERARAENSTLRSLIQALVASSAFRSK